MAGLSTIQQNIYDGESCTLLNCMDSTGLRLVTRISTAGAQDKVVANTLFKEDAGSVFNNYCVSCPESKFTTKVIFALSEAEVRGWRLNTSEHSKSKLPHCATSPEWKLGTKMWGLWGVARNNRADVWGAELSVDAEVNWTIEQTEDARVAWCSKLKTLADCSWRELKMSERSFMLANKCALGGQNMSKRLALCGVHCG